MQTIPVKASKSYNVHVGSKLLPTLGERLADLLPPPRHLLLVTDDTVAALYADTAADALEKAGYTVTRFVFASVAGIIVDKTTPGLCQCGTGFFQRFLIRGRNITRFAE